MKLKRSCVFASVLRAGKKQSRRFGSTQLLLGASLITLVGQQVQAQDLFWDPKVPDVSPSGIWNSADLDWDQFSNLGGTDQTWVAGSIANFQQVVGGTVTLVGTQTVSGLNASSPDASNWVITGGSIALQGAGGVAAGAGDSLTVASDIDGAAAAQALNFTSGGGTVIVSGDIGSNVGTVTSDANLTLSGTNTFSGSLNVNSGTTTLAGGAAVADTSGLNLTGAATVVLSNSETVGPLSGSAGTTIEAGLNTLTANQTSDTTFAGNIDSGNFTKSGSGALTFSGSNSYTGLTLISQGTLNLTGSLASGVVTVNPSAIFTNGSGGLAAAAVLNNNGTVNQNSDDTITTLNNTGTIDGDSTLTATTYNLNDGSVINAKLGSGTVNANGTVALNATSAAGTFNVVTGETTLGSAELLLDTTNLTITAPATLKLGGAEKIGSLNGSGSLVNNGFLLSVDSGAFSGNVSGLGGLTKVSSGVLTLSGLNEYSGATSVDAGTLTLTGAGSLANSLDVTVALGATLNDNNSGLADGTVANVIGTLRLGANETIKTLNGSGTAALNGSLLTVSDGDFSGVISSAAGTPAGRITKVSDGNLVLSGNSTYTGSTLVNAGAIIIRSSNALGATAGASNGTVVASGATVALEGGFSTAELFNITGAGDADFSGAIDSTGNNTLTGQITMTGLPATIHSETGTLNINGGLTSSVVFGRDVLTFSAKSAALIDVNGVISNSIEAVRKIGPGTLDLSGTNHNHQNTLTSGATFQTEIVDGTIIINNDNNLGERIAGNLGGVQFNGALTDVPTLRINGDIDFEAGSNDRQFQIAGPLGQFDVTGAFEATIGNNDLSFTSATHTLRKLGSGTLNIDTDNALVDPGDAAFIDGFLDPEAGELNVLGAGFSGLNPTFGPGGIPLPGTTTLNLAGLGDADGGQTGTVNLGLAGGEEFDNILIDQSVDSIFDGTLNTTGDLTITGAGDLQLNGANNIGGNVHVSGNELMVNHNSALGNHINSHDQRATFIWGRFSDPLIPTALTTPGKLSLSGGVLLNERLTIVNGGILNNEDGINTVGSAVRIRFDGALPLSGIPGPYSARIGSTAGNLILQGGIFSNPGQTVNLNGLNTDAGTVTVAGPIQSTVADVLLGNSANTTNTVDLQVQNFYSGNTTLNGGNVIVGNNQSFSGSQVTVDAATDLDSNGNVSLGNAFVLNSNLTTGGSTNTLALNGTLSGGGGITNAAGSTTLGGTNTYAGPTTVSGGTLTIAGSINNSSSLQVDAGASLVTSGSEKLADAAVLDVAATGTASLGGSETIREVVADGTINSLVGDLTVSTLNGASTGVVNLADNTLTARSGLFSGNLVGINAELIKNGGSTLTLSGDNSGLTGKTTVNNGILAANDLGSSSVDIKTGGQLTASGTFAATNINVASGATMQADTLVANAATINNSGTVNITSGPNTIANLNFNAASAAVNVTGGDLTTGGINGTSGTLDLAANGFAASSGAFGGSIIGSGAFTKTSAGALTLSGNNNGFTGTTSVNGGTLALQSALGSTGITVAAAGTLTTSANEQLANTATLTANGNVSLGGSETIGTLAGSGTVDAAGNLSVSTLNGSAQINAGSNTVTAKDGSFAGSINGNGGLVKNSTGTLSLTASNSYTGTTQVNAGTLALSGTLQSTAVNVANGAALTSTGGNLFGGSSLTNHGQVTIDRNETITSYASGGPGVNGSLLGTGTLTASTYALNDGSTVSANTGTGIITTNGAVTINAANTGASAITVQTGVLDASGTFAANQIGVNSLATLNSNGMLAATANVVVGGTMNVGGATTVQSLSITPASGIVNLNGGNLITTGLNGSGTLNLGANSITAASGTFSGTIDGLGGLTKVGGSTLTLAGTNSYTGATHINAGTLSLQSDLASLAITIANGAFLETTESEQLRNAAVVNTSSSGTLDLGGDETIGQLNGAGSVILGANTLTLTNGGDFSGNISGTGETIVTGGTLTVSAIGGLNSDDLDIQSGSSIATTAANLIGNGTKVNNDGTLDLGGSDTVESYTSTGTLNGSTLTAATYALNSGSIVNANTGAGVMTTRGTVNINSANTGAGTITIQTGILNAGDASGDTFAATGINVNAGGTLNLNGTLSSLPTLDVSGTANLNTVSSLTGLGVNAPGLVEINAASLTTLNLSGDGTVDLNANTFNVSQGAFSGTLLGTGTLNKNGAGLLSLSGTNSYTGPTNVNAGTLNAVTALNTSALTVASGATYLNTGGLINPNVSISNQGITTLFGNEQASVYNSAGGTLNGAGTLTAPTYNLSNGANTIQGVNLGTGVLNSGPGTVTLLGNSAANDVNVLAGVLRIGANLGGTGATVDISGGATLELLANPALSIDGDIADTAIVNNVGTLTLAGDDLIASYTSGGPVVGNGLLNGSGTLTAATYNLNGNSVVNANLGLGNLFSNGIVRLNGTSASANVEIQSGNLTLGSANRLADLAMVKNDGVLTLNGDDTIGTYTSTGDLNGTGTLTALSYFLNNGSDINANIGQGTLVSNGLVTLNGSSGAAIVNIQTGTLTLGAANRLADHAAVNNDATLVLNGDDLVASYTSTGTLNGTGTLTAGNYFLNSGSAVNANIGTGTVTSNGNVALNGTSAASTVNIVSGNLTLASAERLNDGAAVTNGAMLTLNGNEIVGSYVSNAGTLAGSGVLTAPTFALNDQSVIEAGTTLGDIATGSSHLITHGQVQLNGTSNAEKVTIQSGSLNGNGALNFTLLEGNGTLNRSLTHLAGQTVNPGVGSQNIGQLTIAGDFANQGNLVIDLNALDGAFDSSDVLSSANADRLIVNGVGGTKLEGGKVELNKVFGSREFNAGESARIIASAGPITMDDFTSFDSSDYVGRMFFDVRNGTVVGAGVDAPEDLGKLTGLTENQVAIAQASDFSISEGDILDSALDADKIALAIVGAYNGDSQAALNQLSPESYAGMTDYGIFVTKGYTTAALGMPGTSVDGSVKSVRIPMGTSTPTPEPVKVATTSVFAGFTHFDIGSDSSLNQADYDINSNGGIAGVRHNIADFTIAGFVGVDQGNISSVTLDADADGFVLGAIASYLIQPEMNLMVSGGVTYGSFEYDGSRDSLLGTVDFNSESDVFDLHFGIEGDAFSRENFRLTPFVQLHYITADTDGFSESGNGSALLVDAMDDDAFFAEIGVKAAYQVSSKFSVNGHLGYIHNLLDSERQVSAALGGAAFTVNSPGLGEDFVTLGVGAQFQATESLRFGLNYRAEFSNDADTANGVSLGASYSF